jgi:hypothetical protein
MVGPHGQREKKAGGWAAWAGRRDVKVWFCCFSFPSFPFQYFTKNLFKIFKRTFNHTINQKPMHST